jgi:hypothetical protein
MVDMGPAPSGVLLAPDELVDVSALEVLAEAMCCEASCHPEHRGCSGQAVYLLEWVDITCQIPRARMLCPQCAPGYLRAAIDNRWCACNWDHRLCDVAAVRMGRL